MRNTLNLSQKQQRSCTSVLWDMRCSCDAQFTGLEPHICLRCVPSAEEVKHVIAPDVGQSTGSGSLSSVIEWLATCRNYLFSTTTM